MHSVESMKSQQLLAFIQSKIPRGAVWGAGARAKGRGGGQSTGNGRGGGGEGGGGSGPTGKAPCDRLYFLWLWPCLNLAASSDPLVALPSEYLPPNKGKDMGHTHTVTQRHYARTCTQGVYGCVRYGSLPLTA